MSTIEQEEFSARRLIREAAGHPVKCRYRWTEAETEPFSWDYQICYTEDPDQQRAFPTMLCGAGLIQAFGPDQDLGEEADVDLVMCVSHGDRPNPEAWKIVTTRTPAGRPDGQPYALHAGAMIEVDAAAIFWVPILEDSLEVWAWMELSDGRRLTPCKRPESARFPIACDACGDVPNEGNPGMICGRDMHEEMPGTQPRICVGTYRPRSVS